MFPNKKVYTSITLLLIAYKLHNWNLLTLFTIFLKKNIYEERSHERNKDVVLQ